MEIARISNQKRARAAKNANRPQTEISCFFFGTGVSFFNALSNTDIRKTVMPANITHMLIAHKAIEKLKTKGIDEFTEFAEELDKSSKKENFRAYMNLGSLGPDLYYYSRLSTSVKDMLKEGFVQAKGVTPWAYHLHSHRP
jgi:hypothetical protein